ncbi:MAG: prepilin-type N-terminal cleavage/methylation domain-containing protein [Nitrospirae bacterium]|nr:prepilin-type N-terminal cleavage/methylation domain-containing protein [Nitrospirota bacterium]
MRSKGFSLVELAIVLVLFGLLFAIGVKMTGPLIERLKRSEGNDVVDAAIESVMGYASINGRLPTVAEFPLAVSIPKDPWGNALIYKPDADLVLAGGICARNSTALTVETCGSATCGTPEDTAQNVAFIVVSSGANLNRQTNTTVNTIRVYSPDTVGVDDYIPGMNRPEAYKDIVKWVVLPELRVKAGCSGSPMKILNVDIPSGFLLSTYSTDIFAAGGVLFADGADSGSDDDYEWCVTGTLPTGLSYDCNGNLAVSAACGLSTGTWQQCTSLRISGTPTQEGVFSLPVHARDDTGNLARRTFGLSISQVMGLHICEEYRAWNDTGNQNDFEMDGGCFAINDGAEITVDGSRVLQNGESIVQHSTSNGSCGGAASILNYNEAIFSDNNADCCIDVSGTDKTCP